MTRAKSAGSLGDNISALLDGANVHDAIEALADAARTLASHQDKPINGFIVYQALRDELQSQYTDTSAEIIAAVNGEAGKYDGYTVTDQSGRASVDFKKLSEYPDIYNEVVKWGAPFKTVRVSGKYKQSVLGNPESEDTDK